MAEKNILASLIEKVDALTTGEKTCVFRGENKDYGKIACTLYREQKKIIEEIIKEESEQEDILTKLDFPAIEQKIIEKAQSHFPASTTEFEILTDLQHYGGKTTLIDCTRNILIALFFACNGEPKKHGRVICLATNGIKKPQDLYQKTKDLYGEEYKGNETLLLFPKSKRNRPTFQGSVFVHAPQGFLEEDTVTIIEIKGGKKGKKQKYLDALQRYHGIDATTVFNDLQGFIANSDTHKTAATYFYIGMSSYNSKTYGNEKYNKAIGYYDKAIALNPNLVDAYYNRGTVKWELGKHEEAIVDLDQAIRLKPDYVAAYNNRGLVKVSLQRYDEAIADYDKAIRINPDYATAYNNRGVVKADLGKYDEAIADYTKAIEIKPDYANAYNNRGIVKAGLGKHDEAIADYDKAIRLQPDYADAYSNRGLAKFDLKNHKEAIADYDKAIRINPDHASAYTGRGIVKADLGKYDEAIADYTKAIELQPDYANAYSNRGAAKDELQRYNEAIADLTKAIELQPDHANAYYNRGLAYKALGNQAQGDDIAASVAHYNDALQDYTKARELEPSYKNELEPIIQILQFELQQLRAKDNGQ